MASMTSSRNARIEKSGVSALYCVASRLTASLESGRAVEFPLLAAAVDQLDVLVAVTA